MTSEMLEAFLLKSVADKNTEKENKNRNHLLWKVGLFISYNKMHVLKVIVKNEAFACFDDILKCFKNENN